LFEYYDRNDSGTISRQEFIKMTKESGITSLTDYQLEQLFDYMDQDQSSLISIKEFRFYFYDREALEQDARAGVGSSKTFDDELEEIFKIIDVNKNGVIDLSEFATCLHLLRYSVNPELLEAEFRETDDNCDGRIDIKEFKQLMKKKLRKDYLKAHTQIPKIRNVFKSVHPYAEEHFTYTQFREAVTRMKYALSEAEIQAIFYEIDDQNSGIIFVDDFIHFILKDPEDFESPLAASAVLNV